MFQYAFFNIEIFPIPFSNTKWIWMSLESFMIGLFSRKAGISWSRKINPSYILRSSAKSCWYCNTYILLLCIDLSTKPYQGLWFNGTHLPLSQNKSVKNYSNFFLSSGGSNFKINNLKNKVRCGMWVHTLLNNLVWSP